MARLVLDEQQIHPAIRERVSRHHRQAVEAVRSAVAASAVVVVGMRGNPFPRRARALLDAAGIPYVYLEYGSYLREWRLRTALKMWCGWPTLPFVFVAGQLVGGYSDLRKLHDTGELARMLGRGPAADAPA
jgi:glutaredoxin-related protein